MAKPFNFKWASQSSETHLINAFYCHKLFVKKQQQKKKPEITINICRTWVNMQAC